MRLIFAGTPEVAAKTLLLLAGSGSHQLVGVLTRPDAPTGRGKRLVPSPVAETADSLGLPVLKSGTAKSVEVTDWVSGLAADAAVVVAYGGLIPENLLQVPVHGWLNVHYSLLPRWRGAAPVQHAIMAGDRETGVSVFKLVPELDAGPVYRQVTHQISRQTAGELLEELTGVGAAAAAVVLDDLAAGTARAEPQPDEGISYAAKLSVADGELNWSRAAVELERQVRACNPNPMAWTRITPDAEPQRLRVLMAEVDPGGRLEPGVFRITKRSVAVGTASGDLRLSTVQPQGKRPMPAADWARGLRELPANWIRE
jgi:methionyl-tRNA formyltransferase